MKEFDVGEILIYNELVRLNFLDKHNDYYSKESCEASASMSLWTCHCDTIIATLQSLIIQPCE